MKARRLVGLSLPAVILLAMLPTASASAAAKDLILKEAGVTVANGSSGSVGITVNECGLFSNGKVTANDATSDILKDTTSSNPECPSAGESISGLITETKLTSAGKATMKGTITVALSATCSYEFKNPKLNAFKPPTSLLLEGKNTGKLKKGSAKTCAKTDPQTVVANITNEVFGEPFEASVS
jgi:hypothetical protein